jgi:hypothetical protein
MDDRQLADTANFLAVLDATSHLLLEVQNFVAGRQYNRLLLPKTYRIRVKPQRFLRKDKSI